MPKEKPIEFIVPPNKLKAKIGGSLVGLDMDAVRRAEAALSELSEHFDSWIADEAEKLFSAWAAYEQATGDADRRNDLHRCAHDLKGLAPTYGFPLVGRVAHSLSKLTDEALMSGFGPPATLLRAHVDAIRAMISNNIRTDDHPVGSVLASELETRAHELLAA